MMSNYTRIAQLLKSLIFSLFIFSTTTSLTVFGQSLTVVTPNGGEVWTIGQVETATWTGQNLSSVVNIEFSYDGGNNWWYMGQAPSGPNGGTASIGVPNTSTSNAKLRISDFINPGATDMSDGPFTVYVPPIFIWEPTTASAVFASSLAQVYWILNISGITLLNAEISIDNGQTFTPVAQNLNALMSYTYIELSEIPADSCILKLYNTENPSQFGLSQVFRISPLPVYTFTSPIGGEIVKSNSLFTLSWTVENPYSPYNYLEFSSNNGATWEVIANGSSQGNSGSVEWFTPNVNSDECRIRITDSYSYESITVSEAFTIMPFPETPVCMVTVDSISNQNVIIWEKPVSDLIADFLVYKESDEANVYTVIDTVGYNEEPVVTDFGSNPAIRPYRYKIGFMDSENRVFPASDYHQTIHLTINQGVNNNWNLIWTPYIGFDYSSYNILRKSGSGVYEEIATVSASFNSFTDFNAPSGDVAYIVKIVRPSGCITGLRNTDYTEVYSNEASLTSVSVADFKDVDFSIYPNPANDRINITVGENNTGLMSLKISDLTGRIVYSGEFRDLQAGQLKSINSSGFKNGMYLIQIASGEKLSTMKIVIRH